MVHSTVVSRTRFLALAVALAVLALISWQVAGPSAGATNAHAAVGGVTITMKVTGTKTGVFKGEDNAPATKAGLITVIAYQYELSVPHDNATGQSSGQRQHHPVTITHAVGGSSPQFLA